MHDMVRDYHATMDKIKTGQLVPATERARPTVRPEYSPRTLERRITSLSEQMSILEERLELCKYCKINT